MATTNATISQASGALANLNTAAVAQGAAMAGNNVGRNITTTTNNLAAASEKLNKAASNASKLGLKGPANKFKTASEAAMSASIIKAVTNTTAGLNGFRNAMQTNLNRLNKNQPPLTGAGIA
jgi:hypothetical protein